MRADQAQVLSTIAIILLIPMLLFGGGVLDDPDPTPPPIGGDVVYWERGSNCDFVRQTTTDYEFLDSWPVFGTFTWTFAGLSHPAIDISAHSGQPIYPAGFGFVYEIGYQRYGYGHYVLIRHFGNFTTRYAHMMDVPLVKKGDWVDTGDILGYTGMTGYASGVHLHFEIEENGCFLDPEILYRKVMYERNNFNLNACSWNPSWGESSRVSGRSSSDGPYTGGVPWTQLNYNLRRRAERYLVYRR